MSKRNQIQFSRQADPKFLQLIKEQIGYKQNEPSVDTKVWGGLFEEEEKKSISRRSIFKFNYLRQSCEVRFRVVLF